MNYKFKDGDIVSVSDEHSHCHGWLGKIIQLGGDWGYFLSNIS